MGLQLKRGVILSYIRDRKELLTGFQENAPWAPELDLQTDFVLVYGIDETMPERIKKYREKGYVVHLMTGCAWGEYQDYLSGRWDGKEHYDEMQTKRDGTPILHGVDVPYMVPTKCFIEYLICKIRVAVDMGAEAIHLEEPEFWDESGYSEAFQREYQEYYGEEWQAPHSSTTAMYRCKKLQAYLYQRIVSCISKELKEYAKTVYHRDLQFYVATHSHVNYAHWKIISPEGAFIDVPTIDGFIAQVWTGTSGTRNVYEGYYNRHTFETAFLEYGAAQELVNHTNKKMWFLHDPIEDFPEHTWEMYQKEYRKTLVASLMHSNISRYEVCPWPNRIFNGRYPRKVGLAGGLIPTSDMEGTKDIPKQYSTLLTGVMQMLGDMNHSEHSAKEQTVGVLMSDTVLFQRSHPDSFTAMTESDCTTYVKQVAVNNTLFDFAARAHRGENIEAESKQLMKTIDGDNDKLFDYITSCSFPNFYGLTLPLIKYGLAVRPVLLDNVLRYENYLNDYRHLILSYDYMKPQSIEMNKVLADWVKNGGNLIYIGDGSDPYHKIEQVWWNSGGTVYNNPAEHLLELLFETKTLSDDIHPIGKGQVAVWNIAPAKLTFTHAIASQYRSFVQTALKQKDFQWEYSNHLTVKRGPYVITEVMSNSCSDQPVVLDGLYADMLESGFPIIQKKTVMPDENAILFDFEKIGDEPVRVIGSCARIQELECDSEQFRLMMKAADRINVFTRIRMPKEVNHIEAFDQEGNAVSMEWSWDRVSQTILLHYESQNQVVVVKGTFVV